MYIVPGIMSAELCETLCAAPLSSMQVSLHTIGTFSLLCLIRSSFSVTSKDKKVFIVLSLFPLQLFPVFAPGGRRGLED